MPHPASPPGSPTKSAPDASATPTHVSRSKLISSAVGTHVGPSIRTGYGESKTTGWDQLSGGRLRAHNVLSDHQPAVATGVPQAPPGTPAGTKPVYMGAKRGFCWPWQFLNFTGSGCWNNPATWNWGAITQVVQPPSVSVLPNPATPPVVERCVKGINQGVFGAMTLNFGNALLKAGGAIVTASEAAAIGVGNCVSNIFNP